MQPFNLILLGDPTAGKATQGRVLVKKYPLREFDFGEWLRQQGKKVRAVSRFDETTAKGILTPTEVARAKFKEVIFKTPKAKGVFFNGNPKMLGEAKLVHAWFKEAGRTDPYVVYLAVPKREIVKRIGIRKKTEQRSDDAAHHLKNRMKYYAKDIPAVMKFFKTKYHVVKISGLGTRSEVSKRLIKTIESLRAKTRNHA